MKAKYYEAMWMNLKNRVINQPDKYLSSKEVLEMMTKVELEAFEEAHRIFFEGKNNAVQV